MKIGSFYYKDEVPQAFIDMVEDECNVPDIEAVMIFNSFKLWLKKYNNLIPCKHCGKILLKDRPVNNDNVTDDDSRCDGMHPVNSCMKCHLEMSGIGDRAFYKEHDSFRHTHQSENMDMVSLGKI